MNARLDISQDGTATVTRPDKAYTLTCKLTVNGDDVDDARYTAADSLAALADLLMTADTACGPIRDDEGQRVGEWEIYESGDNE